MRKTLSLAAMALLAFGVAACDPGSSTTAPNETTAFNHTGDPAGQEDNGHLEVCKVGTAANFKMTVDGGTPTQFSLAAGQCTDAFVSPAPAQYSVVIEELASPTYNLLSVSRSVSFLGGTPSVDNPSNPVTTLMNDDSAITITFTNEPVVADEGCTPGYYKNLRKHMFAWTAAGWHPTSNDVGDMFSAADAGAYTALGAATLHEGLSFQGGDSVVEKAEILLRAAIAAVLNADNGNVAYPRTSADIMTDVNAALASGDPDTILQLASDLDEDNNLGCPLGNGR